jgi:hypothetical protein
MIRNSSDQFFLEMGEQLLLIGEEVRVGEIGADRIDLLAIDREGSLVVMELKRSDHKLQLLQGIAYAGMVANWQREEIVASLAAFAGTGEAEAEDELERFVNVQDLSELNETQRVVLVADAFDYEVLVAAEWLTERYGVDVRCYRLTLSVENGSEFMSCTCIYPPREITEHSRSRIRPRRDRQGPLNWDDSLEKLQNVDVVEFFRDQKLKGQESRLGRRPVLYYRILGRRRYACSGRRQSAYVWQMGRFSGDQQYWQERLGASARPEPVKSGRALRFFLSSKEQFAAFEATQGDLASQDWINGDDVPDDFDEVEN